LNIAIWIAWGIAQTLFANRSIPRKGGADCCSSFLNRPRWYFFPKAAAVIVQRIIEPALLGSATDEAAIAAVMPTARICIAVIDRLLGAQQFLAGDKLSIADLMLASQLDFFADTPEGRSLLRQTRLKVWLDRMKERPSMRATLRPEALRPAA
jgi:glutathione S-transferase